jgi:excisionase family DNA binding protein
MSNEERIKMLFAATPEQLARVDAALTGAGENKTPVSLRTYPLRKAALEIGVSRSTLWRAIKAGTLATVKIRRAHRISEIELRRFVEGGAA